MGLHQSHSMTVKLIMGRATSEYEILKSMWGKVTHHMKQTNKQASKKQELLEQEVL